jgi:hypothetical protein
MALLFSEAHFKYHVWKLQMLRVYIRYTLTHLDFPVMTV